MDKEWGDLSDPIEQRALCLKWGREDAQRRGFIGTDFERYMFDRAKQYMAHLADGHLWKDKIA